METTTLLALLTLTSCGGSLASTESNDSGASTDDSGALGPDAGAGADASLHPDDATASDAGAPVNEASSEPSDGACNVPLGGGVCASCTGGKWHCGESVVLAQCPSGAEPNSLCKGERVTACITCGNAGSGYQLLCIGGTWEGEAVSCSP